MPDVRPFRGLRYDTSAITDLGAVLCPPYDVISTAERERLAARHARNAVQLELPAPPAGGETDAYGAAAQTMADWLVDGTLRRDDRPLVYVYEQRYPSADGQEMVARSFFCRLGLEEYGPGSGVQPHELTMSGPKEDRFRLLSAVRTNLSPVLLLYDDGAGGAASGELLAELTSTPPAASAAGPDDVGQRLWAVDPTRSPAATGLLELAAQRTLTIADGHHRYETALRFRAQPGAPPGAQWVLALLYDAHSGGLALRPWHRLISGAPDGAAVINAAGALFDVERVSSPEELLDRVDGRAPATPAGTLGLWTRAGGALLTVDRRRIAPDRRRIAPDLPAATSETLRWLDVSVLSGTLPQMIGGTVAELSVAGRLSYVSDGRQAMSAVDSGGADIAFLLRPTPVEVVQSVAAEGGYMPAKSTLFHPKAATGLVFNVLDE